MLLWPWGKGGGVLMRNARLNVGPSEFRPRFHQGPVNAEVSERGRESARETYHTVCSQAARGTECSYARLHVDPSRFCALYYSMSRDRLTASLRLNFRQVKRCVAGSRIIQRTDTVPHTAVHICEQTWTRRESEFHQSVKYECRGHLKMFYPVITQVSPRNQLSPCSFSCYGLHIESTKLLCDTRALYGSTVYLLHAHRSGHGALSAPSLDCVCIDHSVCALDRGSTSPSVARTFFVNGY